MTAREINRLGSEERMEYVKSEEREELKWKLSVILQKVKTKNMQEEVRKSLKSRKGNKKLYKVKQQ